MYRHILAAVNEYSNSEVAARYAVRLAQVCQAPLSLIFVAEPGVERDLIRQAEAALERLFLEAEARGVEVESIIKSGDPYRQIAALVQEKEVSLFFAATRHEDVSRRYFVKTLARKFMLHLPCSVALVRVVHPGRISPKKILVPCRGRPSHPKEKAFFVAKLAQAFEAAVTLFYAPEPLTGFFRGIIRLEQPEAARQIAQDIERFKNYLKEHQIVPETRQGQGPASRAITVEAALQHNDLIILGASERGLWESVLRGDPVEQVLRETPCNLIIFLPRRHQS
ncbi:MAG: universal stress protein [Desulfobaccales bacterium]